jgi:predicted O-linked N-acetylglucosamine transferase (SPINDLY family)
MGDFPEDFGPSGSEPSTIYGMATISEALAIAIQHHQAGRLQVAEQIYRRILQVEPDQVDALHLLGVIAHQMGKHEVAVNYIRRAVGLSRGVAVLHNSLGNVLKDQGKLDEAVVCYCQALELKPDYAEANSNLGVAFKDQGKLDEAVACYRRAMELNPDCAETHNNLGVALQDQGKLEEAIACYRRAVELKPGYAEAHCNLGNVLKERGKLDEVVACYRRVLELKPDYAEVHNNLGNALKDQGKLDDAVACYCRALALRPGYAEAHNNLGNTLKGQGKPDEAVACYRRALELEPDFAEAHNNLGAALKDEGKMDDAVACWQRALELKPHYAEAHYNLGGAFQGQGKPYEAVTCYRRALELKPGFAEAHCNLGNALKDQGELDEAVACYRRALALKPAYAMAHSNLLFALQYCAGVTAASLAEAHAEYDRRHAEPLRGTIERHANTRDRRGRLRLGFISPDLGRHPVGFFLVRVLENLRQDRQQTICYSDRFAKDDLTNRLQAAANHWRDVIGMNDERLAEQIRADRINILFDLAGHTAHNRLLVFARKPAPIQVTWAGYVGTTGLKEMDYLLADRYEVPEGTEHYYREQVLRMPEGYVCYDPPTYAPPVTTLPALDHGRVAFGCFNNPAKITPQVVEVWAKVLRRLPGARLVLKFKGWNDGGVARRFGEMFVAHAIDPGRLEFLGNSPHEELLAEYNRIDLALDPFPYSGGLTTCEALWMGVPVVTCPGETFANRHSLSHLSNVGLTETIAHDLDEYVELAVSLAGDLPRLAALRAGLRERMAASPLCDGKRFATQLMLMLQELWDR